jgi:hypothetical protein
MSFLLTTEIIQFHVESGKPHHVFRILKPDYMFLGVFGQAGFFLNHYINLWQEHIWKLYDLYSSGKLKVSRGEFIDV